MKIPHNIMDLSRRTITKVMKRMNLACSNCKWNEEVCDIHHIIPKKKGGTDAHANLCYLCPNCHRLAHAGKIINFVTLQEHIGKRWRDYYYARYQDWLKTCRNRPPSKNLDEYITKRRAQIVSRAPGIIQKLESSGIDFTRYGWVTKATPIIGVSRQKVIGWLRSNAPEFYAKCYKQSTNKDSGGWSKI